MNFHIFENSGSPQPKKRGVVLRRYAYSNSIFPYKSPSYCPITLLSIHGTAIIIPISGKTNATNVPIIVQRKYFRVFSALTYTASIFCSNMWSLCCIFSSIQFFYLYTQIIFPLMSLLFFNAKLYVSAITCPIRVVVNPASTAEYSTHSI